MSGTLIDLKVVRHEERRPMDARGIYARAAVQWGRESVFIVESLSGPRRDRRATIIGRDPLFEVRIDEGQARLRDFLLHAVRAVRVPGVDMRR